LLSTTEDERAPFLAKKEADLAAKQWKHTKLLVYPAAVLFVITVGIIAWTVSGNHHDTAPEDRRDMIEWRSQAFGWSSAVLYSASVSKSYDSMNKPPNEFSCLASSANQ
jgi:hypothetical protein